MKRCAGGPGLICLSLSGRRAGADIGSANVISRGGYFDGRPLWPIKGGAARFLSSLSTLKGGWVLPAAARLSATWPRALLWMYQLRRMLRNSPSARRVGA